MSTGYFYANIDLSLVPLPVAGKWFVLPCGCPHCGHAQNVPITRVTSLVEGRLWKCVEKHCEHLFLVDIDKATAEIPTDLLAPQHEEHGELPELDFTFAAA